MLINARATIIAIDPAGVDILPTSAANITEIAIMTNAIAALFNHLTNATRITSTRTGVDFLRYKCQS